MVPSVWLACFLRPSPTYGRGVVIKELSLTVDTHLFVQSRAAKMSPTVVQIALVQSVALLSSIFAGCAQTGHSV